VLQLVIKVLNIIDARFNHEVYKTYSTLSSINSFSLYTGVMVLLSILSPMFL